MIDGGAAAGRIKSIIARGALCMAVLAGNASLASACGNELIYFMVFRAYPEAGRAYAAELEARRAGELPAAVWSAPPGLTYHDWSLKRARKVLDRLAARLHRATQAGGADFAVSVLLVDELYVAQLHPESHDAALKPLGVGHSKSDISLYTTANALRALVKGRVPWQEAVERDLVVLAGPVHQQETVNALLRNALSGSVLTN